jgi:ABC-type glutathione transport system ATPase component
LAIGDEVLTSVISQIVLSFFYLILTAYLNSVLPSDFGVPKAWYWPFLYIYQAITPHSTTKDEIEARENALAIEVIDGEDDDVREERKKIAQSGYPPSTPLIVNQVKKIHKPQSSNVAPKLAVKNLSFAVEERTVFGLLGPNGAGKSTLISIMTGLYPATSGEAVVAGFNIKTDRDSVYQNIGVCPQVNLNLENE